MSGSIASCANLWPIRSVYVWKGRLEEVDEVACLFKTTEERLEEAEPYVLSSHPYDVSPLLRWCAGSTPTYAAWVRAFTAP